MKYIKQVILGFVLLFIIGSILIVLDGITSGYKKSTYAVVLGNQVLDSGKPSDRLKARLDKALELYNNGKVSFIIVSGGIGKEGYDEAFVMKQYLLKNKIPAKSIIMDSKGYTTRLTAKNARQWVKLNDSVIIVSQLSHLSRCKLAFRQAGFKQIGAAYPLYFELRDLFSITREVPAWIIYYIDGITLNHSKYPK